MRYHFDTKEEATHFLEQADVFHYGTVENERKTIEAEGDPDFWTEEEKKDYLEEVADHQHLLNMNDVWGWACADAEKVEDEELEEVADLVWHYGWAGILYWVSKKRGGIRSEFYDNNRMIEFVENEERIRTEVPDYNKRAYHDEAYTITGSRNG